MNLQGLAQQLLTERWNQLVPKHAVVVQIIKSGVRWLHPTKGWRYVSLKRLNNGVLS